MKTNRKDYFVSPQLILFFYSVHFFIRRLRAHFECESWLFSSRLFLSLFLFLAAFFIVLIAQ